MIQYMFYVDITSFVVRRFKYSIGNIDIAERNEYLHNLHCVSCKNLNKYRLLAVRYIFSLC